MWLTSSHFKNDVIKLYSEIDYVVEALEIRYKLIRLVFWIFFMFV